MGEKGVHFSYPSGPAGGASLDGQNSTGKPLKSCPIEPPPAVRRRPRSPCSGADRERSSFLSAQRRSRSTVLQSADAVTIDDRIQSALLVERIDLLAIRRGGRGAPILPDLLLLAQAGQVRVGERFADAGPKRVLAIAGLDPLNLSLRDPGQ